MCLASKIRPLNSAARCFTIFLIFFANVAKADSFFTIIDDDAADTRSLAAVKSVADANGVKVAFAAIARNLLQSPEIVDTLLSYQRQGFEVINHSLTHDKEIWTNGDAEALKGEILRSRIVLDSLGFTGGRFFVYPFGKFPPARRDSLKALLSPETLLAFDSRGNVNRIDALDKYYISRLPLRRHDDITVIKSIIDSALGQNSWIVFITHSNNQRDFSPGYLDEIIKYCKGKKMECLTVSQAYDRLKDVPQKDNRTSYTTIDEITDTLYKHSITLVIILFLVIITLITYRMVRKRRKVQKYSK